MVKKSGKYTGMRKAGLYIVSGLLLTSCGGGEAGPAEDQMTDNAEVSYTRVEQEEIMLSRFTHTFEVQGIVEAEANILIAPELPGLVREIKVKEGASVSKGSVIMVLDADVMRRNIDEIKTQLDLATQLFDKQKALWDQKIGSEVQYLQAKTQKESLENTLSTMKAQLDNANIKAPVSGVIDDITPKLGEMVSPPMPVARLVNLSTISVKSEVSERYLLRVQKGDSVSVRFPAIEKTVGAVISRVGTYINPDNRTFEIGIDIPNPNESLKPNLLAIVSVTDIAVDSATIVPSDYIQIDPQNNKYVFIAKKSSAGTTAEKRIIEESGMSKGISWVSSGVEAGEYVVTEGFTTIMDGQTVEVANDMKKPVAKPKPQQKDMNTETKQDSTNL